MVGFLSRLRSRFRPPLATEQAFELWGDRARERQSATRPILAWSDSPVIQHRYIYPTISGEPDVNWLTWAARQYFAQPVPLALTVGSGDGGLERHGLVLKI